MHKIVCGLKPQFTIIQHFSMIVNFQVLVRSQQDELGTGAEKEQSMVCLLHYSILISNFLHFDDRKNLSQFRQKMNVYGLVRPSPDRQDGPKVTNRR